MTDPAAAEAPGPSLHRLADALGVATDFWDFTGRHRTVGAPTIRAVLSALGVEGATEEAAEAALAEIDLAPWRATLPPSVVIRAGREHELAVHVPDGSSVQVHVAVEDGRRWELGRREAWTAPRDVDGVLTGRATFVLPADLPLGWHELVADVDGGSRTTAPLAVTPDALSVPSLATDRALGVHGPAVLGALGARRGASVTSPTCAELSAFFGDVGADFLLINPLHAAEPIAPMTPSPYLPSSRRFVNPLYIRVEDIPETAYLPGPERSLVEWAGRRSRGR